MKTTIIRSQERGLKDIGWLQSNFSFSFSGYYNPVRQGFGLLKVFNDDYVKPAHGFGLHAHLNMEIISVMLQGKMNHKDTQGYAEVVEKDWVQIMSAGSGLRHEEHNIGDDEVNFLQIWIEPKLQNIIPRYQRRRFPQEHRKNKLVTIVSNEEGSEHCWINQNAQLSLGFYEQGQQINYNVKPLNRCVFIFNISGQITVAGETLQPRDSIGLWETDTIEIAVKEESQFILIDVPINH